jgi:TonB-linked SusC/RagA family outer membrane protein
LFCGNQSGIFNAILLSNHQPKFLLMKNYSTKALVLPFKKRCSGLHPILLRIFTFSFFLLFFASPASAQSKKITGKIIDNDGKPLSGVTVTVEGTTVATVSDNLGQYNIETSASKATLVFSFVGFASQQIRVGSKAFINVSLNSDVKELQDVVVVGYGTQKKSDLTGSVSVVSAKDFDKSPVIDALSALQGKVPGLQITSNSGQPGSGKDIQIRGLQSLGASTTPLYVIDGTITDDITNVSPGDIENITVLKDAASAAIYGARSANGVILITTKRGSRTKLPVLTFHTYQGIQTESNLKLKLLNASQYVELDKESYENAGFFNQSPYWDQVTGMPSDIILNQYKGVNTDWLKIIRQNGSMRNYDLSVNGGNERSTFFSSVNYIKETGRSINTSAERVSFRLNSDHRINNFIQFGNSLNIFSAGSKGYSSPYQLAQLQSPLTRPYESDGTYGYVREPALEGRVVPPQIIANEYLRDSRTYGVSGNIYLKINILKGLTFTPRLSLDYTNYTGKEFTPAIQLRNIEGNSKNSVSKYNSSNKHWIADYLLNYDRTFNGVHNISALAGYSQEETVFEDLSGLRFGTPNNNIQFLNAGEVAGAVNSGGYSDWAFISMFGRLNYNYDGKYFAQATVRRDGSSRFLNNNRWGVFPSYAVGWKISKEKFFKNFTGIINDLKLRASIGTLGNANVGNYPAYATLNQLTYTLNNTIVPVYTLAQFVNKGIKWETTQKKDFGIDVSFFKSKLTLTADYYIARTTDLLFAQPVPISAGSSVGTNEFNPIINGGEIQNKGFEFTLGYQERKKDFSWDLSLNFAANHNKVVSLNGQNFGIESGLKVGEPLYSFAGYKSLGIIKTQDILDKYPQKAGSVLGDLWIQDIDGYDAKGNLTGKPDGIIDFADRTFIGKNRPDFTYGLVGGVTYKNISFQIALMGVQGFDLNTQGSTMHYFQYPENNDIRILDRWNATKNPNGNLPRVTKEDNAGNIRDLSTFWLSNASFLRINNVNINYSFPESIYRRLNMKKLDVYLSAQNLYTFTSYPGQEVDVTDGGQFNRASSKIPQPRTLIIGIKTSF